MRLRRTPVVPISTWLLALWVTAGGCSTGDEYAGSAGEGTGGRDNDAASVGGAAGVGGIAGAGGLESVAGAAGVPDGGGGAPDASLDGGGEVADACSHEVVTARPANVDLYIMADRSGSMSGLLWGRQVLGLRGFFKSAKAGGATVALGFFPSNDECVPLDPLCSGGAYLKPLVDWGPLPAQADVLSTAANAAAPTGCLTTMQDALTGMLEAVRLRKLAAPTRPVAAVLLSDGASCCGNCPCEGASCLGELVATFAQGPDAFPTYSVYFDTAAKDLLDSISQAGGTAPAYDGSSIASVTDALLRIRTRLASCRYGLPSSGSVPVDPSLVDVFLNTGTQEPTLLAHLVDATQCHSTGGWYVDNPSEPATIALCPSTCQFMDGSPTTTLSFDLGCEQGGTGAAGGAAGGGGTGAGGNGGGGTGPTCGLDGDGCPGTPLVLEAWGTNGLIASALGNTLDFCHDTAGSCVASGTAPDAIYRFNPSISGTAVVTLAGDSLASWDAALYARTACGDGATEVGCSDAYSQRSPGSETLKFPVASNTDYFVFVDGYSTSGGAFELQVTVRPEGCGDGFVALPEQCDDGNTEPNDGCGPNCQLEAQGPADLCPGAELELTPAAGRWTGAAEGTTVGMTAANSGPCGSSAMAPDQVYYFTAPTTGSATVALIAANTSFDSVIYARSGACDGDSAAPIGCQDRLGNGGDAISFPVSAGQQYWVFVDGYLSASGSFRLEATVNPKCGDAVVDDGETCDDGNTLAGDGCDATCAVETACTAPSELEPDSPWVPSPGPASCGTWEITDGTLTSGDADFFSFAAPEGTHIEARTFVGTPGTCLAGTNLVVSLSREITWSGAMNSLNCSYQLGAEACGDVLANGSCSALSYNVGAGEGSVWQIKVHPRDEGATVPSYGLIVTVR